MEKLALVHRMHGTIMDEDIFQKVEENSIHFILQEKKLTLLQQMGADICVAYMKD
jgi:hypothetical protein